MNLFWCSGQELLLCGLMDQGDIVLILTTEDVELGITRTLTSMSGFPHRDSHNRCTELNS
eukprot:4108817-Amphidinium_carterae.3